METNIKELQKRVSKLKSQTLIRIILIMSLIGIMIFLSFTENFTENALLLSALICLSFFVIIIELNNIIVETTMMFETKAKLIKKEHVKRINDYSKIAISNCLLFMFSDKHNIELYNPLKIIFCSNDKDELKLSTDYLIEFFENKKFIKKEKDFIIILSFDQYNGLAEIIPYISMINFMIQRNPEVINEIHRFPRYFKSLEESLVEYNIKGIFDNK